MKKTERIEIRVTPEEKMAIVNKSIKAKKNVSEFLICSATNSNIKVINDLPRIITELNRIGNNINQLTRQANSGVKCIDLEGVKKELNLIWQSLNLLITK